MQQMTIVLHGLGGLGLFLLGMIVMTEGLRALAGDALRAALMRFTRTPLSGAVTGAACTALLQSSSATTVAAVGFVGAGLMSFSNALGIVFGANIGTTMTGWLVALIGFKLKLQVLALPLVFAGAVLRLFGRGRTAHGGLALAGFALIFIGIDVLQDGMRSLQALLHLDAVGGGGWPARFSLLGLGIVFTVVTQSSSAAVAASLSALNAGLVGLPEAACFVIGADIGTTATAVLAAVGASTEARRTALSHVVYNLYTGCVALLLLSPYLALARRLLPAVTTHDPEFVLVAFHTGFNVLCVCLVLPFAVPFARLVRHLVPHRGEVFVGLDEALLEQPALALAALHRAVEQVFVTLVEETSRHLGAAATPADLQRLQARLDELQDYAARIDLRDTRGGEWDRLLALIHVLDHLQRLHERLDEEPLRAQTVRAVDDLRAERDAFIAANGELTAQLAAGRPDQAQATSAAVSTLIHERVAPFRDLTAAAMAARTLGVEEGTGRLEAVRWLRRVGRHVARAAQHLATAAQAAGR